MKVSNSKCVDVLRSQKLYIHGKVKVELLTLVKHHDMKTYGRVLP
jgi:hypothetical protein